MVQLMTLREVATETGLTYDALKSWTRRGTIPAVKIGGRVFVDREQLAAFIEAARIGPRFKKAQ